MNDRKTSGRVPREGMAPDRPRMERLERSLQDRALIFDMMLDLLGSKGGTFGPAGIARLVLSTVIERLDISRAALYLIDPDGGTFSKMVSRGDAGESLPSHIAAESGFARWVARSEVPVFVDRYFETAGDVPSGEMDLLSGIVKLGFPYACSLERSGDCLGIMLVGSKSAGGSLSELDEEFLRMAVRVAAVSTGNAMLHRRSGSAKDIAEEFSKEKKEYIVSNSLRLREPLSVMKSSLWSIETDDPGSGIMLDMARDAAASMESALERLIAISEIDIDDPVLDLARTDLASLVEDCLREYIADFEEKGVSVSVRDRSGGRSLYVDPAKILVVLRSIVDNALRSVGRGGRIVVETLVSIEGPGDNDGIELKGRTDAGPVPGDGIGSGLELLSRELSSIGAADLPFAVISIKDDGSGMVSGDIPHPSDLPGKTACRNGTGEEPGMGLIIAQSIVAAHGGRLLCRSDEGGGTVFSAWLPITH